MGFWSKLFGKQQQRATMESAEDDSAQEDEIGQSEEQQRASALCDDLMQQYSRAHGDPQRQRVILAQAAQAAKASGDMLQQMQVVTTLNEWERRHKR